MKKERSAKLTLWKTVLLFLIPFLIFLVFLNIYSNRMYRQRLAENNQSKISMYESMLSEDIKNIEYFMSDMIANDGNYRALMYPIDATESYLQTYQLGEKFESVMKIITSVTGFTIVSPDIDLSSGTFRREVAYEQKEAIINQMDALVSQNQGAVEPVWEVLQIPGENYFYKIMGNGGVYSACLINARDISLVENKDGAVSYLLFEKDGKVLAYQDELEDLGIEISETKNSYISGTNGDYFIVGGEEELFGCRLILAEAYKPIWSSRTFPFMVICATIMFILLLICCYRNMKKQFLKPLEQMVHTMEQIKDGELEKSLSIETGVLEYKKIEYTFNDMMEKIRGLKILAYDRLLQVQKTKMQYYQIQIRPHFFLNCMKNLYAMAEGKKYEKIQEMILTLSSYLRAVLKDYSACVPLKTELDGVRAYVALQQMSNANPVSYEEDVSGELESFLVPPMSILTFVENSFKYEKDTLDPFHILVKAKTFQDGEQVFVNLTIMDNGKGFSQRVLEILNDPEKRLSDDHIGIFNVRQRFELLYQNRCSFLFSNMDGACVDIFIPGEGTENITAAVDELGKDGIENDSFNCG